MIPGLISCARKTRRVVGFIDKRVGNGFLTCTGAEHLAPPSVCAVEKSWSLIVSTSILVPLPSKSALALPSLDKSQRWSIFFFPPQFEDTSWLVVLKYISGQTQFILLWEYATFCSDLQAEIWISDKLTCWCSRKPPGGKGRRSSGPTRPKRTLQRTRKQRYIFLSTLILFKHIWRQVSLRKITKQYSFTTANPAVIQVPSASQTADWPLNHSAKRIYARSAVKIHHPTYLVEEGRLTCWCGWHTWLQSNLLIHQTK